MIPKDTIDTIFETARVEEVVGDFVSLKKRGVNMIGLCPFHDEKTPSFTVSPTKGIYKCFGCGEGGNSVNFVMAHEQMTYPEALRYLAKKYNIEIEEEEQTPEQLAQQSERESLFVTSSFAQKHFTENLWESDEGKSIGLSYFRERGYRDDVIKKFQLGYSIDNSKAFTEAALKAGHEKEYLAKTGICIQRENGDVFDRFYGRVMFPIHNITGRVIAFGGRTLRTDKKIAKYINSPETDIYHKSKILYGLYQAKKSIIGEDNCYLVEGYTDVVSLHQVGIENVVASSGTSLTVEQIRLIRRYTKNITILYDGDAAGIKASFRGIDLILEEGMNVKVLLFPDGEDPDSYSKKVNAEEYKTFIASNSKDFIAFKTELLSAEAQNDPIKKAGLIKDIVESISLIPDAIVRSVYVKECSTIMGIGEQVLLNELNKLRRKKFNEKNKKASADAPPPITEEPPMEAWEQAEAAREITAEESDSEWQEKDIVRILLTYHDQQIKVPGEDDEGREIEAEVTVAEFIVMELSQDQITFNNPLYQKMYDFFAAAVEKEEETPNELFFIKNTDEAIKKLAIDIISFPYSLSENWETHNIQVETEDMLLKKAATHAVVSLKEKRVEKMIAENDKLLKATEDYDEQLKLVSKRKQLDEAKKTFSKRLGRVVIK